MDNQDKILSGSLLAKNTVYNFIGLGSPIIVAIFLLPVLIKGLGTDRFGILNLAWVVIGYFSLFDFGIGRALTQIIAEKIGSKDENEIPGYFWTSLFMMLIVSTIGSIIIILFTPYLINVVFKISNNLKEESYWAFFVLGIAIPIVTTTAGLRGVLEAYQKFAFINIVRIIFGIFTFVGPVITLFFTNSLFYIISLLVIARIIFWFVLFQKCFKISPHLSTLCKINMKLSKPILNLSGWMTISNLISPALTYMDRFIIGSVISVTAVTFYSTPFEVISKLLIISSAVIGVLFPAFSSLYSIDLSYVKKLFIRGIKYIFLLLFPLVIFLITFANEILNLWLGPEFSQKSGLVFQLLSLGVLINSLAYIPHTFIQGIGRPNITAKIHMIELPVYIIILLFAIRNFGINGAAFAFLVRVSIDTVVLFLISNSIFSKGYPVLKTGIKETKVFLYSLIGYFSFACFFAFFIFPLVFKIIYIIVIITVFIIFLLRYILEEEEKLFLFSKFKLVLSFAVDNFRPLNPKK